uniref:uncharacterized protein LOC120337582 isoform X2 n=1 Tax=Styela clava TaxID=7725 RepID=UPI001939584B|nr:uncharacterized protein LOC120337582 isoform X2 [Styela clava]
MYGFLFCLVFALISYQEAFGVNCPRQEDKVEGGRTCQPSCKYNRECTGKGQTCNCDDHCGMSCFNKKAECEKLPDLQNGKLNWSSHSRSYAAIVRFQCNAGYRLSNSENRKCRSDLKWSGSMPLCEPIVCTSPSDLQNGYFKPNETEWSFSSEVTYYCNKGFKFEIKKHNAKTVTLTCDKDGKWTEETPECVSIQDMGSRRGADYCHPPPVLENGGIEPDVISGNVAQVATSFSWVPGDVITYYCKEGFLLTGSEKRKCDNDGSWTGMQPECVGHCSTPPSIKHGWFEEYSDSYSENDDDDSSDDIDGRSSETPDDTIWQANITIVYKCMENYVLVQGSKKRTCHDDGSWTGSQPMCVLKADESRVGDDGYCDSPPDIQNGWVSPDSNWGDDSYTEPEGGNEVLPPVAQVEIRWRTNDVLVYRCLKNYELVSGSKRRICNSDGTWTGNQPRCVRKVESTSRTCSTPTFPRYGTIVPQRYMWFVGNSYTVSCNTGYEAPLINIATCLSNGMWSPQHLECKPIQQETFCVPLPTIQNGWMDSPNPGAYRYLVGQSITYRCRSGYKLVEGSTTRTCSSQGSWTGSQPSCKEPKIVTCNHPSAIGGVVSPQKSVWYQGDTFSITCFQGYNPPSIVASTCLSSGSWSPSSTLECKRKTTATYCDAPPAVENGRILLERNRLGGQESGSQSQAALMSAASSLQVRIRFLINDAIVYKCKDGYVLTDGSKRRVCSSNGWTGTSPTCKTSTPQQQYCDPPPPIDNGWVENERNTGQGAGQDIFLTSASSSVRVRYLPNDVIVYKCRRWYELDGGSARRTCYYGIWTGTPPSCKSSTTSGGKCGIWRRFDNGLYYTATTQKKPFDESHHYCKSMGGDLVDSSLTLPSVISGVLRSGITMNGASYWIGLKVIGQNQWMWRDNMRMTHAEVIGRFHYADVLNRGQGKSCGLFPADPSKKWRVGHCQNDWHFAICQKAGCDTPWSSDAMLRSSNGDSINPKSSVEKNGTSADTELVPEDDQCQPNPCLNNCECQQSVLGYSCNNIGDSLYLGDNCEYESPDIFCGHDSIVVTLGGDIVLGMDGGVGNGVFYVTPNESLAENFTTIDMGCRFETFDGETFAVSIPFPFDSCGTKVESVNGTLAFKNTIWFNRNVTAESGISVKSSVAGISCSYQDIYKLTTTIDTICCRTPPLVTASGVFEFQSSLWTDPPGINGTTELTNGKIRTRVVSAGGVVTYRVGEMLYLTIEMRASNARSANSIFPSINMCWISSNKESELPLRNVDLLLYPRSNFDIVKTFGPLNTHSAVHFGFQVIQAKRNAEIFLHCQIQIQHKRSKRSWYDESGISLVTKGPIVFSDGLEIPNLEADTSMESADGSSSQFLLLGISIFGIFLLTMLMTCCLVHLRHIHKRQGRVGCSDSRNLEDDSFGHDSSRLSSVSTVSSIVS